MKFKIFRNVDFYSLAGRITAYSLGVLAFLIVLSILDHFLFNEKFRDILSLFGNINFYFF
jgi:hypothetical protein